MLGGSFKRQKMLTGRLVLANLRGGHLYRGSHGCMTMISFPCPSCSKQLQAPDDAAGKTGKCNHCGGRAQIPWPVLPASVDGAPSATTIPAPILLSCPACGSEQTQRISVIYEAGTSQTISHSHGGGIAFGESEWTPILGGGQTSSAQQTALAQRFAPPAPQQGADYGPFAVRWLLNVAISAIPAIGLLYLLIRFGPQFTNGPRWTLTEDQRQANEFVTTFVPIVSAAVIVTWLGLPAVAAWFATRESFLARVAEAERENEKALVSWHRTFFCHRCGSSFIAN